MSLVEYIVNFHCLQFVTLLAKKYLYVNASESRNYSFAVLIKTLLVRFVCVFFHN